MSQAFNPNMNPITNPNPLLAHVKLPGRIFQLPSKGLFYQPGVLAPHIKDGEIEVKPMSALAEMKIRSGDLLYSGKIIRELCMECAPDILNPEALVTKDVDALFCFLRVVTYGTTLTITSAHPDCPAKGDAHEYTVNIEPMLGNPKNAVLEHRRALYTLTLSNGQVVHSRPATYQNAMQLALIRTEAMKLQREGQDLPEALVTQMMVTDLLAVIESVEVAVPGSQPVEVTNQTHIAEWVKALTKTWLDEIFAAVKKTDQWGYDFTQELTCKDCGAKYKHDLELDPINFFFG